MRSTQRLRAGLELLGYAALMAGLPLVLLRFGGIPSASELRVAMALHWVSAHLALQLAGLLGWVVYTYLAVWAVFEVVAALRQGPSRVPHLLRPLTARMAALALIAAGRVVMPAASASAVAPPVPVAAATVAGPVDAPAPVSSTLAHHTVVDGDCLWDLAVDYYGDGTRWTQIWQANRSLIPDPREILPGQVLVIPDRSAVPADADYKVEPGDSLWSVADQRLGSGSQWTELWEANADRPEPDGTSLTDPNLIRPGWTLAIPPSASPQEPSATPAGSPTASPATAAPSPPMVPAPTAPPAPRPEPTPESVPLITPVRAGSHSFADQAAEAALLLPVGAAAMWWGVRRRRRAAHQRLRPGRLPTPVPEVERGLEHSAITRAGATVERIDAALRHLRMVLGRRHDGEDQPVLTAVLARPDGSVEVVISSARRPPDGWSQADDGRWLLPAATELELPPAEWRAPAPCPSLVTVGTAADGSTVLLHLEAAGAVRFSGGSPGSSRDLARRWAAELALAPYASCVKIACTGLGELPEGPDRILLADDVAHLASMAESAADWGRQARLHAGVPLVAGRLLGTIGDPLIVVFDPDSEAHLTRAEGMAVVGTDAEALEIDLDSGAVGIPGVGLVRLGGPDGAEIDAVVRADAAALHDQGVDLGEEAGDAYEATIGAAVKAAEDAPGEGVAHRVTVEILGEVRVDGVGKPKRTQLIAAAAALAAHKDGMSRSKFVDIMWHSEVTSSTVSVRLSELRSWLGGRDTVVDNGDWIRLGDAVGCDWWDFERLARNPLTRLDALRLVRNHPLTGVLMDWEERDSQVEAIEARIITTALATAEEAMAAHRPEDALTAAECALRLNEFDQRAVHARMRAYAALGDVGGVEGAYADAQATLTDEEDLDPETIELYGQLMKKLQTQRRRGRQPTTSGLTG